jgi:hypothetical protein
VTRAQAPPAADAALAGSPVARRLLREAPERLGRLDVVGPAGTGKSVLLHALADVMERAGHTVLRELPQPGRAVDARAALLVDDAHRLSPADLTRLTTLAEGEVGVLVVAHRPWPARTACPRSARPWRCHGRRSSSARSTAAASRRGWCTCSATGLRDRRTRSSTWC